MTYDYAVLGKAIDMAFGELRRFERTPGDRQLDPPAEVERKPMKWDDLTGEEVDQMSDDFMSSEGRDIVSDLDSRCSFEQAAERWKALQKKWWAFRNSELERMDYP